MNKSINKLDVWFAVKASSNIFLKIRLLMTKIEKESYSEALKQK